MIGITSIIESVFLVFYYHNIRMGYFGVGALCFGGFLVYDSFTYIKKESKWSSFESNDYIKVMFCIYKDFFIIFLHICALFE
jgi:hydrogenase maturation factor HypE